MTRNRITIYILIDWYLPAYKAGGPIQSIANLVAQPEEGVQYRVVCSNRDLDGTPVAVETDRWLPLNPWTKIYYSSAGTTKTLWGAQEDVLFINGIYSWHYNIRPILFGKAKRKIVSGRGMLNTEALAQKSFKKKIFLAVWNLLRINKRVEFHAASREEAAAIKSIFGQQVAVHVAPNYPRVFAKQAVALKQPGALSLVSVALISPMKNILLVLQALQTVSASVDYHLYGPVKEAPYWQECLALIKTLPPNIRVHYHGDAKPGEVEEVLHQGQVFILPSKFENFCHAIYEALTAGKPVITSHNTPWKGLEAARAGRNVSTENEAELASAIRAFASMRQEELEAWSEGARRYAETAIDLEEIRLQYRKMFRLSNRKEPAKEIVKPGL